jgi:hypothetical protein
MKCAYHHHHHTDRKTVHECQQKSVTQQDTVMKTSPSNNSIRLFSFFKPRPPVKSLRSCRFIGSCPIKISLPSLTHSVHFLNGPDRVSLCVYKYRSESVLELYSKPLEPNGNFMYQLSYQSTTLCFVFVGLV